MHPFPLQRWLRTLGTAILWAAPCAMATAEPAEPAERANELNPPVAEVAARVRALEAAVEADRTRLLLLVSTPRARSATPLYEEPELKEIARRLPGLQDELALWADFGSSAPASDDDAAAKATP